MRCPLLPLPPPPAHAPPPLPPATRRRSHTCMCAPACCGACATSARGTVAKEGSAFKTDTRQRHWQERCVCGSLCVHVRVCACVYVCFVGTMGVYATMGLSRCSAHPCFTSPPAATLPPSLAPRPRPRPPPPAPRWFVLSNFTLSYFDKRDSKEAKGSLDLSSVGTDFLLEEADTEGKAPPTPHCLKLVMPGRNFHMAFNTETDKDIWKAWLNEVHEILFGGWAGPTGGPPRPSSPFPPPPSPLRLSLPLHPPSSPPISTPCRSTVAPFQRPPLLPPLERSPLQSLSMALCRCGPQSPGVSAPARLWGACPRVR
jgi:hypothetical protein